MGFSQELKDFNGAFTKMYKPKDEVTDLDEAKAEYYRARAGDVGSGDGPGDALKAAKTEKEKALADRYGRMNQPKKDEADNDAGFKQWMQNRGNAGAIGGYSPQQATPVQDAAVTSQSNPQKAPAPAPKHPGAMNLGQPMDVDKAIAQADKEDRDFNAQAVKEGLEYNLSAATQPGATGGQGQVDHKAVLTGANAVDMNQFQQALQAVDPENKMSESERNINAVGLAWDYYSSTGQHDKAQKVAGEMISTLRTVSARYASFAQAAAEKGDMDGATKALVKMYANIPDGNELKVAKVKGGKYKFTFTDKDGRKMEQKILSPTEIAAQAMKITPAVFDQFIISAAGKKAAKGGKGKSEGALGSGIDKSSDRKTDNTEIDIGYNAFLENITAEGSAPPNIPAQQASNLKSAGQAIYKANGNTRPEGAVKAAYDIMRIDPASKDMKAKYQVATWDGHNGIPKGTVMVKYPGGKTIKVPEEVYSNLIAKRTKRVDEITKERERKAKGEKYRSDIYDTMVGKLKKSVANPPGFDKGPDPTRAAGAIGS